MPHRTLHSLRLSDAEAISCALADPRLRKPQPALLHPPPPSPTFSPSLHLPSPPSRYNYVLSLRNLNMVASLNRSDGGSVEWILSSNPQLRAPSYKVYEFAAVEHAFYLPHHVTQLADDRIILVDDGAMRPNGQNYKFRNQLQQFSSDNDGVTPNNESNMFLSNQHNNGNIINSMSMRLVLDAAAALSDMDDPPRAFVSVMPEASAKPSSSPNICLCTWCQSDKRSFKWSSARVMLFTSSSDVFPSATKQPRSIKSTFRPSLSSIAASILSSDDITLKNLPYLQDITTMFELIGSMGADISLDERMNFKLNTSNLSNLEARYELVKTMRASILVLGSMIAKYGYAKIALPGGCAIGSRPVNYHLKALEKLGVNILLKNGYIEARTDKLVGANIEFEGVTVTGTENLIMAASLAKGVTVLTNVAKEPEISDLADFLNSMGAKISGAGTDKGARTFACPLGETWND